MIRWLFIALIIYLIYRLITGPGRKRRQNPFFTFRFGVFPGNTDANSENKSRKKSLDQIEDAEFEDITEKDIKEKKADT